MTTGFQQTVNLNLAVGVEGDFASANTRTSVLSHAGAHVAGLSGVTVGRFAWVDADNTTANNFGAGLPDGFVARRQQGLITVYLAETSMAVRTGFPVTLFNEGEFWVKNSTGAAVSRGQKAYANFGTGAITFGATGAPPSGASVTASIAANATTSFTGVIADRLLTASSVTGVIAVGGTLSGTGVTTGTTIVKQLTGTTGAAGTYEVSVGQTTASTTITETYGVMTVSAVGSGAIVLGQTLSGSSVVAGTTVTQFGTGTGGTGTYFVSNNTVVSSTTITAAGSIETKWYAADYASAGDLVKMSSWTLG